MNAFELNGSDMNTDESQATQLIHAALEKSPEPLEAHTRSVATVFSKDSIDSFPFSKNSTTNSTRQYHFHGLAVTQTETQLNEDGDGSNNGLVFNEGSQKENYVLVGGKTGKDIKWGMPSPDSRPSSPYEYEAKENPTLTRGLGRVTKFKSPTVAFDSPARSPMSPKPVAAHITTTREKLAHSWSSRHRDSRSSSPALSDDSFAQGDTQLAEERFLVTSKKFTMPLADLAHGDDDVISNEASRQRNVSFSSYPSQTDLNNLPPVILVPSTPSQSGSSDQSEESFREGPALLDQGDSFESVQSANRMVFDSDLSKGSQRSQGYDGQKEVAEVQDLYSDMQNVKMSTQPLMSDVSHLGTQQATQVVSQDEGFVPETPSVVPQTNTSTYTHTGPRSLLSTMDPHKRGRYQHLAQLTPASPISPVPQQFPAGTPSMVPGGAEMQPTPILERRVHRPLQPTPPHVRAPSTRESSLKKPTRHYLPPPPNADVLDIVPDSEPMRGQSSAIQGQTSCEVGKTNKPRRGERIITQSSSGSEITEDSDVPAPKKIVRREEEEEEEINNDEEGGGEAGNSREEEYAVEEHEESGIGDDEPLSARLRRDKGKIPSVTSNTKATSALRPYTSDSKLEKPKKPQANAKFKRSTRQLKVQQNSKNPKTAPLDTSHESAIPSSVPDQDHPQMRSRKLSSRVTVATKNKEKQAQRKSSRETSVARSTRSRRSTTVEVDVDRDVDMDTVSDSERATEVAVEGEDEQDYLEPEAPQQNRKRKRGRLLESKPMNPATTTPRTRSTKRLKSAGSTMSRVGATRVFALWSQNNLWYSGVVHEYVSENNYTVKFDDGYEMIVTTDNMRHNNLRAGDLVRIGKKSTDYKVLKVNHWSSTAVIDLGEETEEIELKDISISTKVIISAWRDRQIDNRTVVPVIRDFDVKAKSTPSPSRSAASLLSLSTKGPRQSFKFLQKVGLIVSLSGNNMYDKTKDGKSRSDILSAVRASGGVVVDDLFKYLKMDISYSSNRWVIERSGVQWIGEPKELQRLFLLADDCNLKPKYLMALALGIPCLSVNWLYACLDAGKELDWRPHLLPQGRPTVTDALPSQRIDLNWGDKLDHLSSMMSNPIAPGLLAGQSVLCVGSDMIPKGRDTEKVGEAASYIIRIILAMGAARVEAVRDVAHSANPLPRYNLLILREKEQYTRDFVQIHTVDWNWIKDSLIMSRRLDYPIWPVDEDSQCSQSL